MATITEIKAQYVTDITGVTVPSDVYDFATIVINNIGIIYDTLIILDANQASLLENQNLINQMVNQIAEQTNIQLNNTTALLEKQVVDLSKNFDTVIRRLGGTKK